MEAREGIIAGAILSLIQLTFDMRVLCYYRAFSIIHKLNRDTTDFFCSTRGELCKEYHQLSS